MNKRKLNLHFLMDKKKKFIKGGKDIEKEAVNGGLNLFSNILKIIGKNKQNNSKNNKNIKYRLVKGSESKNIFNVKI